VLKDLPHLGTIGDERDDAHLAGADRANQWKHFVDAGDQCGPQVVRRGGGTRAAMRSISSIGVSARSDCLPPTGSLFEMLAALGNTAAPQTTRDKVSASATHKDDR
jgi:hypothetical protein